MKKVAVVIAVLMCAGIARGQGLRKGTVIVPPTNSVPPQDIGKRSHTNFLIFVPSAKNGKPSPQSSSPTGEIPQSLSCVYQTWAGNNSSGSGCPITTSGYALPSGGANVIAIVDAYDYPTASSDFQTFAQQFGLPYGNECGVNHNAACFQKVYASGTPKANCGWAQEESLDIEWSHAMAPYAQIILVEAASNSNANLLTAVQVASNLVASAGGGEVSMSWGGSEFSSEVGYDSSYFSTPGVTYFASSGDTGGKVIWPSASFNVVSAGGTSVNRNSSGLFANETTWTSAGGGPSSYETAPLYQEVVPFVYSSGFRGTPDISFDANPYTGVSVYDSTSCQGLVDWMVFGGTSVASPSLAGIANESGAFTGGWDGGSNGSSVQSGLYANYNTAAGGKGSLDTGSTSSDTCTYTSPNGPPFNDITTTSAGSYNAMGCWDYASGIGSVRGLTAFSSGGSSSGGAPPAPTGLTATAGNGQVTLSWNASSGATSYDVLWSTSSSGPFSSTSTTSTPYTVSGLTNGTLYYFEVEAVNSSGTSAASNEVSATPTAPSFSLSASPTSFSVKQGASGSSSITATSSGGFTGSVTLSVSDCPTGATCSLSSTSVTFGTSPQTSALTVATTSTTPTGTYAVSVSGSNSTGTIKSSTTVSVTVTNSKHGKHGIR